MFVDSENEFLFRTILIKLVMNGINTNVNIENLKKY